MDRHEDRTFRDDPADRFQGPTTFFRACDIRARQHHDVRAVQGGWGFTQNPARQDMGVSEGAGRVEQNDIQIPVEPQMLKPVVQNKNVRMKAPDEFHPRCMAIPADAYGDSV